MIPLVVAAVGTAARVGGTRVVAGAATRTAAGQGAAGAAAGGRAMQFGGKALQMNAARHTLRAQQQPQQQPQPRGFRQHVRQRVDWAKQNPIEATIGASALMGSGTLASQANNDFDRVTNSVQFG